MIPFSMGEYQRRWRLVGEAMVAHGVETAVVWGRTAGSFDRAGDLIYLTNYFSTKAGQGFDSGAHRARAYAAAILRAGSEPELIADDLEVRPDFVATDHVTAASDPIAAVVASLRRTKTRGEVGLVGTDFFPMKYWAELQEAMPEISWKPCDDLVRHVRIVKSPAEQDVIRRAGQIASDAMTQMMEALIAGQPETEAAALASAAVVRNGGVIDRIWISHGDEIAFTAGNPMTGYQGKAPRPGDMIRAFVIGPMQHGYYLDPGRTAVAGKNANSDQKHLLESCIDIVETIAKAIRPGFRFDEAAAIGDRMTADFGGDYDPAAEKYPFFGHPHGLYFEGPPYISTKMEHQDARFATGMLIGVEAFLARSGVGNAAFEQNYLVHDDGLELLTTTPMAWH